jgi:hypothetical protein
MRIEFLKLILRHKAKALAQARLVFDPQEQKPRTRAPACKQTWTHQDDELRYWQFTSHGTVVEIKLPETLLAVAESEHADKKHTGKQLCHQRSGSQGLSKPLVDYDHRLVSCIQRYPSCHCRGFAWKAASWPSITRSEGSREFQGSRQLPKRCTRHAGNWLPSASRSDKKGQDIWSRASDRKRQAISRVVVALRVLRRRRGRSPPLQPSTH